MKALSLLLTAAIASALLCTAGCTNIAGEWQYEEMQRVKSPDGVVDAVLVRGGGGATTGFSFSIFLVRSGTGFDQKAASFEQDRAVFRSDHHDGLHLVWTKPQFLEIRFAKARIFHFANFWHSSDVQNYRYVVEVRLIPLDASTSLTDRDRG
jgi:hypothetical protein